MINQVVANPDYTSTSNQYGFYALPKTVKPKPKYREENDEEEVHTEHMQDDDSNAEVVVTPLQEHPEDQRRLERDYYVNEAPWPQFREKQPGLDIGVQVEDGDLFDFDHQVQPLLEILVGQSLVKARNELQEEHERQDSEKKLSQFSKKRNAELMVTQRLEAQRKRKTEEAERRVLQHKVHKDQKKALLKKIISHKESKNALIGLRGEVLYDLEQEGLLRNDPYLNLRTGFEPWLYEQIIDCLEEEEATKRTVDAMCNDKHKELSSKHNQHIERENQRRKEILDQRQKERLAEQERKRKRAIKKHRKALNAARVERQTKLFAAAQKGDRLDSITKAQISDGTVKAKPAVYISGGVLLHLAQVLDVLAQLGTNLSDDQIEDLLIKVLSELSVPAQIPIVKQAEANLQSLQAMMKDNFAGFYKKRQELIEQATSNHDIIGDELRRVAGAKIKPTVLKALAKAILNIYLSQAVPEEKPVPPPAEGEPEPHPEQAAEPPIVLSDRQNQRLAVRNNLSFVFEQPRSFNPPAEVLRIRVPIQYPEQEQEPSVDSEYIEIFDGEGWLRTTKKHPQRQDPADSLPHSYNLTGFERTYVYDEIANYHFEMWLLSLLQKQSIQTPEQFAAEMHKRNSLFEHLGEQLSKDDSIAIYDFQAVE